MAESPSRARLERAYADTARAAEPRRSGVAPPARTAVQQQPGRNESAPGLGEAKALYSAKASAPRASERGRCAATGQQPRCLAVAACRERHTAVVRYACPGPGQHGRDY